MRIILIVLIVLLYSPALAGSGTAEGTASIVDPYEMDERYARIWCEENPESKKCQRLQEEWDEEEKTRQLRFIEWRGGFY